MRMLSPVGYHGEIPGSHSNRDGFYDNSSFGSPGNIQGFYGNVNDSAFNLNQFPWFSSPFLPVSMTTRDCSSALRQDVKTLDGPSSAQGHYAFNSDSSAGTKRKRASEICKTPFEETESNKRQKLSGVPETASEVCKAEVGETNDLEPVEDQTRNSDSSLHVDLEQWC